MSGKFLGRDEVLVASPYSWSQDLVDGVLIIRVSGELDMSSWDEFGRRLQQVARCGDVATVVLDVSGLSFIDGHSVGLIAAAEAQARVHGRAMRVDGPQHGAPAMVFKALRLDHLLARPGSEER